jgi:y4mF family transcriptional regulator
MTLGEFIRSERRSSGLTQVELARKAGVGLRLIRDIEQGKATLRMDTVDRVLAMFGKRLGPVDMPRET